MLVFFLIKISSFSHNSIRRSSFFRYGEENTNPRTTQSYFSTFTPKRSHRNSSLSTRHRPSVIHDEIWLSNKQYNSRVTTFIDNLHEKANKTNRQISDGHKSLRSCTHQGSTGEIIYERVHPATNKTKLCLHIAVNGASKSMRGAIPLLNSNLNHGDFGDDAGMFIDNRDCCFVGKLK
jgi:NAD-dependent SIR2 family protein deacetylase